MRPSDSTGGTARRALLGALGALLAAAAGVPPAAAQQEGLRKSDLVHALVVQSPGEAAAVIRGRCLSFRPTELDLEDLRALGAEERVMEAIRGCMERAEAEEKTAPAPERTAPASEVARADAPPPPAVPRGRRTSPSAAPLTLFLAPQDVVMPTGREVSISAQVTSGAEPVPGLLVTLHERDQFPGDRVVATARTDERGAVEFQVPVGHAPGVRRYELRAEGRSLSGRNVVLVQAVPSRAVYGAAAGRGRGPGDAGYEPAAERTDPAPAAERGESREGGAEDLGARAAEREARLSRLEEHLGGLARDLDSLADARSGLGVAYVLHLARHGRYEAASAELTKLDARNPGRTDVLEARGYVSLWRGDAAEAVERFRELVRRRPGDPGAWEGLGRALSAEGRAEEATEAFERARSLRP